jgi:pimeloyl-ACP methyl ester carboxylesterase/DNA-binding CsgD family transcriptional regulator
MDGTLLDQEVRFCRTPRGRVAYAAVGTGPVLLLPGPWISHVELEWEGPELRAFISGLARHHRVVRYDRIGTGLSDRDVHPMSVDAEVEVVEALLDELGVDDVALFGFSWGGCVAVAFGARHPDRLRRAVLYGTYAHGGDAIAPAALRQALVDTVRAHWGAGSRALADVWLPNVTPAIRRRFTELQRAAATATVAADALEVVYATDVSDLAPRMRAPALVVHRRRDRAIPHELGRELATLLPDAQFTTLSGDAHPPWIGDAATVVRAADAFLAPNAEPPRAGQPADGPLTEREREVLQLIATGMTNEQIAAELILSPHTVHRHVANVRLKLGQPSRAAAAAYAARHGLI